MTLVVHSSELAILTSVLACQAEDGLGHGVYTLIDPAEVHAILRILIHRHGIDEVEVGYRYYEWLEKCRFKTYHFLSCRRHHILKTQLEGPHRSCRRVSCYQRHLLRPWP